MDFYLDTGVVFGYGYKDDKFCSYSERLTKKYPFKKNNYHSNIYILNKELENLYLNRLMNKTALVRKVRQKVKVLVRIMNDISYQDHRLYQEMYKDVLDFLETHKTNDDPKNHDAIHLVTAHIWDYNDGIPDPYFLTTDKRDIFNNKAEIQNCVNKLTNCKCKLKIEYLIDFTKPFGT